MYMRLLATRSPCTASITQCMGAMERTSCWNLIWSFSKPSRDPRTSSVTSRNSFLVSSRGSIILITPVSDRDNMNCCMDGIIVVKYPQTEAPVKLWLHDRIKRHYLCSSPGCFRRFVCLASRSNKPATFVPEEDTLQKKAVVRWIACGGFIRSGQQGLTDRPSKICSFRAHWS